MEKLIKRAKKKGYHALRYTGQYPLLNRFLERYGFQPIDASHDTFPEYQLDLLTERKGEVIDVNFSKRLEKDLHYLRKQAATTMNALSPLQFQHLEEALLQAYQQGQATKIHLLYGALSLLKDNQELTLLDTPCSLKKIFDRSTILNTQSNKKRLAKECTRDLANHLQIRHPILQEKIENTLLKNSPNKWSKLLKDFFEQQGIHYDPKISYNYYYLTGLNPNKEPRHLGSFELHGKEYQLLSLITKQQMVEESKQLNHCVGESDVYIESVEKGEILVISLRDKNNTPLYTIEYDITYQSLKQFKGKNDEMPEDMQLIIETLNTLEQS